MENNVFESLSADLSNHGTREAAVQPVPVRWNHATRLLFRMAFIYFSIFIFAYGNGSLFSIIPWFGNQYDRWSTWPLQHVALWVGPHVFHLKGLFATFHPTGSGDTAMDWVLQLLFVLCAVLGGFVWTAIAAALGHRRQEYGLLYAWLRFGLRLTLGFFMVNYGVAKVFPFQMPPISIGILNEPVGQMSPMTFLWAMLGLNPAYEVVCGAAEVIGGLLMLFRRTALAGAMFSAFVLINVVLYNFFFDVPVKLFAANLLLGALFVVLPDVKPLFEFFWLHKPSAPVGVWVPPVKRKAFRIATAVIEIALCLGYVLVMPGQVGYGWYKHTQQERKSSPLMGAWHLDPAHPAGGPFVTGEGLPSTDLYVDTVSRAFRRSTDLALWRTYLDIDEKADTVNIYGDGSSLLYSVNMPDPDHLVLVSRAPKPEPGAKPDPHAKPFVTETVLLTRTPTPAHYPLLDRGFHFVNEWGLER